MSAIRLTHILLASFTFAQSLLTSSPASAQSSSAETNGVTHVDLNSLTNSTNLASAPASSTQINGVTNVDLNSLTNSTDSTNPYGIEFIESLDAADNVKQLTILQRDLKDHIIKYSLYQGSLVTAEKLIQNISLLSTLKPDRTWIYKDNKAYFRAGPASFWGSYADAKALGGYLLPFMGTTTLAQNDMYQDFKKNDAVKLKLFGSAGDSQAMAETLADIQNLDPKNHPDGKIVVNRGAASFTFAIDAAQNIKSLDFKFGPNFHTRVINVENGPPLSDIWNSALRTQRVFGGDGSLANNYNRNFSKDTPVFGIGLKQVDNKVIADHLLAKSPARLAGINEGDEILTINGVDVGKLNATDLMDLVTKPDAATIFFKDKSNQVRQVQISKVPLHQAEGLP